MTRTLQQAAAQLTAATLALLVTMGTLVTLDTLAQAESQRAPAGELAQQAQGAPRG